MDNWGKIYAETDWPTYQHPVTGRGPRKSNRRGGQLTIISRINRVAASKNHEFFRSASVLIIRNLYVANDIGVLDSIMIFAPLAAEPFRFAYLILK
jgi:hypothetical protein